MCDYILSRPLLPEEFKIEDQNTTKIKKAIEAIAFMSEKLLSKEKKIYKNLLESITI